MYSRPSKLSYIAAALLGAIIGGLLVAFFTPYLYGNLIPYPSTKKDIGMNENIVEKVVIETKGEQNIAQAVAKKVMPSVVGISTVTVEYSLFYGEQRYEGVGSGVVVNQNGYILTNSHVVGDNPKVLTVYFMNGDEKVGRVLWQDPTLDLAVVKVDSGNLTAAEFADSDALSVGEEAIAIGNPLGLRFERTVTQGIVSGLNRSIMLNQNDIMEDLIQTDAAINPGNSGGPLINSKGQIIGINTVKASAEGLGFAIPINITKPIISKLVERGSFTPTYLGVSMYDRELAGYYEDIVDIKKGVFIIEAKRGLPAYNAGIRQKDIITHIDGVEVNTMLKVKTILYAKSPGDKVKIRYIRDGREFQTEAILQKKPGA